MITEEIFNSKDVETLINLAFEEDIQGGDITTENLIPKSMVAVATMTAKAEGVLAGIPLVKKIFEKFDPEAEFTVFKNDGDRVSPKDVIIEIRAKYQALLTGERTALNFFQRMSGIATESAIYADEVKEFDTEILDTRKTCPGFRLLDKYSVKMGGATNHRIGLYDMVMIKDNHIKLAGSITKAVEQIRSKVAPEIKVEVETTNLDEVIEAVKAGADIIMLDNMSNETMTEAVNIIDGKAKTEASGNMSVPRLKGAAETGVDYISVGALTHSVTALDISMNFVY